MKRRDFVSRVLITGGAFSLGIGCKRRIEPANENERVVPGTITATAGKTIREPERQIPILAETDVLVIGGGPAGVAAGLAVKENNTVRNINIRKLKEMLKQQGAWLG